MQLILINLKQRIDKNYKKLQRKCLLTKPILEMINLLLTNNSPHEKICQWFEKYESTIYIIRHNLILIEQKKNYAK